MRRCERVKSNALTPKIREPAACWTNDPLRWDRERHAFRSGPGYTSDRSAMT